MESFPLFRIAPTSSQEAATKLHVGTSVTQSFKAPESLVLHNVYVCFREHTLASAASVRSAHGETIATASSIEATDVRCRGRSDVEAGYWSRIAFDAPAPLTRAQPYELVLAAPNDGPMQVASSLVNRYPYGALSGTDSDALMTLSYQSTDNPRLDGDPITSPEPIPAVVDGPLIGATEGESSVTNAGGASYRIDIQAPPGTRGVQPKLSVSYDSHDNNVPMGVGWSLRGLSRIHRCSTTLVHDGFIDGVDFDDNDRFCLDGQRLVVISDTNGQREYRTEKETFTKIVAVGDGRDTTFTTWTKSGDGYDFGYDINLLLNPTNPRGTNYTRRFYPETP